MVSDAWKVYTYLARDVHLIWIPCAAAGRVETQTGEGMPRQARLLVELIGLTRLRRGSPSRPAVLLPTT